MFFRRAEPKSSETALDDLRRRIPFEALPEHVSLALEGELDLLSRADPSTSEHTILLAYVEYISSLPWNKHTEDNLDLSRASALLNERHYGLGAVKERILEHLAVRTLIQNRKPRILVVDDEKIARDNLRHVLLKENYSVETAADGLEAIQMMRASGFDIVLADMRMEKMNGLELLERVSIKSPETRVVMITAHASVDSAVQSIKKGAFDYITKPFRLEAVRSTVAKAAEKKTLMQPGRGHAVCFAGPPGTGKTSIGRAIAEALGRKFGRIALGGLKDEAEVRGHRKTYAGAMPGRIIEEFRRAGCLNPVIMLDELDKLGPEGKGDAASALLEALDPEQNRAFIDHYVDLPFDLSGALFIATANVVESIPRPLLDRLEVIEFSGYTDNEKRNIGLRYLAPRQIVESGLSDNPPVFTAEAVDTIVREHTQEAGIRGLDRNIGSICRKIAFETASEQKRCAALEITAELVGRYLGPPKYHHELADSGSAVGVATGLVWSGDGGEIIFVETAMMKGSRELTLTGSLGPVMQESAKTALSFIRSNAALFGISEDFWETHDIHVHVPAGAIPKDGPSAGATIALALISLLTGRPLGRDIALAGEITLSGTLLPVGGLREKLLAANRAGVKTVILPARNAQELESLPEDVRQGLTIIPAGTITEIADKLLNKK